MDIAIIGKIDQLDGNGRTVQAVSDCPGGVSENAYSWQEDVKLHMGGLDGPSAG